jgi:hypothetical protein
MSTRIVRDILADLQQSQQAFLDLISQIDGELIYQAPAGDEWTLAVIFAHLSEARQFYANEVQKVLASPGVKMGRTVEHPGRLQSINEAGHNALADLRQKLITSHESVVKALLKMSDDDLQLEGDHVVAGPESLASFIQRFMVDHDQAHIRQANELLAKLKETN